MSTKPYKEFEPKWVKESAPDNSYRSIFRWGDPSFVKYPKESLYKMMKEKFQMTDEDFSHYAGDIGMDPVKLDAPCNLMPEHLEAFAQMVGKENVTTEDYPRLAVAYGKPVMMRHVFERRGLTAFRMWCFILEVPMRWSRLWLIVQSIKSLCMCMGEAAV